MLCLEVNTDNFDENYRDNQKSKMTRSFQMHCMFRSNVHDVKMLPLMTYRMYIMRILEQDG